MISQCTKPGCNITLMYDYGVVCSQHSIIKLCDFCGKRITGDGYAQSFGFCSDDCGNQHALKKAQPDPINPKHYRSHPTGIECIDIIEVMPLNPGTAIKYIWRAGLKTENPIEDLNKAKWYIEREIARLTKEKTK